MNFRNLAKCQLLLLHKTTKQKDTTQDENVEQEDLDLKEIQGLPDEQLNTMLDITQIVLKEQLHNVIKHNERITIKQYLKKINKKKYYRK